MACRGCLARSLLLRDLAPNLDRAVARGAGERARDLLGLSDAELAAALTSGRDRAARALAAARAPDALAELRSGMGRAECKALCRHSPGWPQQLARLSEAAPHALFLRGDAELLEAVEQDSVVTVVGSRRASSCGRETAAEIAAALSAAGITVMSGMAFGIDSAAHEGALAHRGQTIAVLGAGVDRAYPRSAAALFGRICESGLAISELPPGSPTFRWTFPARNRLMAALGAMTVLVESAERSGSLITAEMAADCGRPVGAVPGPVNAWRSVGTNQLLADGACLVRSGADVLDAVFGVGAEPRALTRVGPPPDVVGAALLESMLEASATGDELIAASGLPAADVAAGLARLELAGYLERMVTGYRRTALAVPATVARRTMPP